MFRYSKLAFLCVLALMLRVSCDALCIASICGKEPSTTHTASPGCPHESKQSTTDQKPVKAPISGMDRTCGAQYFEDSLRLAAHCVPLAGDIVHAGEIETRVNVYVSTLEVWRPFHLPDLHSTPNVRVL